MTLTASRGRGKSATLGLSLASAIAYGYANMYTFSVFIDSCVTSPSVENVKTLFEFCLEGLHSLGYKEHLDFSIEYTATQVENGVGKCIRQID